MDKTDKDIIVISMSVKDPGSYSKEWAERYAERCLCMGEIIVGMLEGKFDRPIKVVGDYRRGEGYVVMLREEDNHVKVRKAPPRPVHEKETP